MDIRTWFEGIPVITRHWFGLTVAGSLLGKLGIFPLYLSYLGPDFINKFHIWRPVTALFVVPISGFHWLTMLFFMYQYSIKLENGTFAGRTADYLYLLIFNWITSSLLVYFMSLGFTMDVMVMSVLYIWCQLNHETIVNFWFGLQFKAYLLPWVLMAFNMIITGGFLLDLLGIIVGHLYYFLMYVYPDEYGGDRWVQTPNILYSYFPLARQGPSRFSGVTRNPDPRGPSPRGGGYSWGSGHTLGRS